MGRQPGHQHECAPPPCIRVTGLLHTHSCSGERPQAVCVCWRGAEHVLLHGLFQSAFGSLGRQPGHLYVCAPPPCLRIGHRAPAHTRRSRGHKPCACAGAAQSMFYSASSFNQPLAAWDVGQVTNMQVRHRPVSWSRSQGSCAHSSAQGSGHNRVRVLAPRSICSPLRAFSTSL